MLIEAYSMHIEAYSLLIDLIRCLLNLIQGFHDRLGDSLKCKTGNTKFSRKCLITCIPGYDCPKESMNTMRCRKEGKFGKQLYGEWKGMATCVGRMCGKPAEIPKATTVIQDIRFPNAATYNCFEGYSQDGNARGPKSFEVPCIKTGNFGKNGTHKCTRIKCGSSPPVPNSEPIPGTFFFSDARFPGPGPNKEVFMESAIC